MSLIHQPLVWVVAVLTVVLLAGYLFWWRSRDRRLRLRIEPVPEARLDNTPIERNEIVSPVRVRNRAADDVATDTEVGTPPEAADLSVEPGTVEPVALDVPTESVMAGLAAGEPFDVAVREAAADLPPAEEPVRLSQQDLFPDATVPVRPRRAGKAAALFDAAEPVAPVDAALRSESEPLPDIELVISLHVMARDAAFDGRKLLELLLQYGLRFGDMNIFHRHEFPTGHGVVLFSMAQAMEPGTFDIDRMERDTVPGVSFFLSLPGYKSLTAYDLMVDTARRLAKELGGDLLDQHSQVVTAGQLDIWRDQVTEFERKRLMSS